MTRRAPGARRWPRAGWTIPGIVAIFDAGQDARARYLVSELVHGRTLDELSADGVLSDRDVLRIGLALCGALDHAHGRGVVHRDVKPQNVIVPDAPRSSAGVAKLADFGVAHLAGDEPLTRTGDVVGTLAYMAPEQAAGRRVDERADLYSLALVVYEALAGTNPVRAGSPAATARRVGTVLPAVAARAQGSAGGAVRRDRPRAAAAARGARDAGRARGRARRRRCRRSPTRAGPSPATRSSTPRAPAAARRRPRGRRPRAGGLRRRGAGLDRGSRSSPALAAVLAVAVLPRLGWLAAAAATIAVLAVERPGTAVLVAAAALPVALLLLRRGTAWSVPALAPLLGLASLAGAYPALAGRAPRLGDPGRARRARRLVGAARRAAARASPATAPADVRCGASTASSRRCSRRSAALRGRLGARRARSCRGSCAVAGSPWTSSRLGLGRRARRRNGRRSAGDRRAGAAPPRARERRRRGARGRDTTPPSCLGGGAVTLGRILCTRNHGQHIPVAAHERSAQP